MNSLLTLVRLNEKTDSVVLDFHISENLFAEIGDQKVISLCVGPYPYPVKENPANTFIAPQNAVAYCFLPTLCSLTCNGLAVRFTANGYMDLSRVIFAGRNRIVLDPEISCEPRFQYVMVYIHYRA